MTHQWILLRQGYSRHCFRGGRSVAVRHNKSSTSCFLQAAWISSDRQRQLENAAQLVEIRKSKQHSLPKDNGVDYRYRNDEDGPKDVAAIQDLWGKEEHEEKEQKRRKKKFVSFFEEVDAIVAERKKNCSSNMTTTSRSQPPKDKPKDTDLKTLLESWDDEALGEQAEQRHSSIADLESIFSSSEDKATKRDTDTESDDLESVLNPFNKDSGSTGADETQDTDSTVSSILHSNNTTFQDGGSLLGSETRSIFDTFPIPEPPPPRSPKAFELEAYNDYVKILEDVMTSEKFGKRHTRKGLKDDLLDPVISWLRLDEKEIDYCLPTLEAAIESRDRAPSLDTDKRDAFRKDLQTQKDAFMEHMGWNEQQYEAANGALISVGHRCAKLAQSTPLDISWEKMKESGMTLNKEALNVYLYASTTYGGMRRHSGGLLAGSNLNAENSILTILGHSSDGKEGDEDDTGDKTTEIDVALPQEVASFHDILYEPNEQSLSIRVRAMVAKGDPKAAEDLLNSFPMGQGDLRHRTYLPVLRLYLEQMNIASALKVFKIMRGTSTVFLEPETYIQLIAGIAEEGFFSSDSKPIDGASNLGYSPACGPHLFDQLASEMAQDILEISSASARRLYTAFSNAFKDQDIGKNLAEIHPLAPLSPLNDSAGENELISSRVTVDASTGVCPRSGATLRLINLVGNERKQLHDRLLELSKTSFGEFSQTVGNTKVDNYAAEELAKFASWLDDREGSPFTAIVDGANVAYNMQNFDQGKFNFHQIQFMVDTLDRKNENPLVILPFKYQQKYFKIPKGSTYVTQTRDEKEQAILDRLISSGKLYVVPRRCLDDFYWMLASVSDQTRSRNEEDLTVDPGNEQGRWAGTRPMLVTNDQMRDHKLSLLEPRLFRRWYTCHIVNYNFTGFVEDECVDDEIGFSPADFFSREIQGNPSPSDGGGTAWHFPVSDWELNERFCVRIPES